MLVVAIKVAAIVIANDTSGAKPFPIIFHQLL
jgi:hypothetical protein